MKRLVVIDGKSVFYRGYYAMPGLSLRDGTPTGGVYGFASLALEVIKKLEPDYVAVAWDKKGTSIRKRLELLPTYKAGRKAPPDDFYAQIPILEQLLAAFNWPMLECDDYEADDIMGTLARNASEQNIETCLITSDLDMLQLVGPLTHVYALKKGFSDIEQFDVAHFEAKYGLGVEQFLDLKSLKGDSSDNIPGVPGIGEKTGIELLKTYKTLDGVYANLDDIKPSIVKKLEAGKESAYVSKRVGEIWLDAPVSFNLDEMNARNLDAEKLAEFLKSLEFTSLLRRLPQHMQHSTQGSLFDVQRPPVPALEVVEWPAVLSITPDQKVLIHINDDMIWFSSDKKTVAVMPLAAVDASFWKQLQQVDVAVYDLKKLYHSAHNHGIEVTLASGHDIAQAAFLLDPLMRGRSISDLSGDEINEANPGQVMKALWRVYEQQLEGFSDEPGVAKVARTMDFPLAHVLYKMETTGIKVNKTFLTSMSDGLGKEHAELEQQMYAMAGYEFNIGSPAQLSEVLFTKLQLPTTGIKKGKTGYSTGQKELDKLRGQHPIIELIERTRELAKLKNTYVDTLPQVADEQSRIHTTFNQDVASTGRLSSTNPNLQNIPVRTELGRRIREAFVPEKGNVFVSADYSQFELRLAAILAGDQSLIRDFNSGVDIHTKTAAESLGIPLHEVTKGQRRAAKVINFGVLYGMSPHGLSAATGMNFIEAKQFIDQYFTLRAPIRSYLDATLHQAETVGFVETYFGRRRPTPDVKSTNFMIREGARRAAMNMPIQGTEADLMKMAMIEVDRRLGSLGDQILQIHDSILIECPNENADAVATLLKEVMEGVYPALAIKLKVDVGIGNHWGQV
jgi:DNA polymerase-1